MQDQLLFVISPPRSGSTLLQRMLGSHSQIMTHPEPHLITPLAYLGFHDTVDQAPYDHVNAAEAMRLFVQNLPQREDDYLDALRAYADTLYGRMLATRGQRYFLDKTPAYGLVLPFLTRLYPRARYVVLTRHPLAVMSSYANSFFEGDWITANSYNPVVNRYVPAIARLLRDRPTDLIHVKYENLVQEPEAELKRIFEYLALPHEPGAVDYGDKFQAPQGMGDPITVAKQTRPVVSSMHKWVDELATDERKRALAQDIARKIDPRDLAEWGYDAESFWQPLHQDGEGSGHADGRRAHKPGKAPFNSYVLQRRVLLALRKDIHRRPLGKLVKRVRYYCDAILRDSL